MKIKSKGKKVHPSPPHTTVTPPPSSSVTRDSLSILNLLPSAVFALVAALSFQDREVLAYMLTRSLKTTTTTSINSSSPSVNQKELKKTNSLHKPPSFDCECFDCYTSFWFRWDSSSNREIIHQAIESFEEHLACSEHEMKRNRRGKKRDKPPLRVQLITAPNPAIVNEEAFPETAAVVEIDSTVTEDECVSAMAEGGQKGFGRKVIPEVFGVLNSRLWNLWGPNV